LAHRARGGVPERIVNLLEVIDIGQSETGVLAARDQCTEHSFAMNAERFA
jgi:hypothetical protein